MISVFSNLRTRLTGGIAVAALTLGVIGTAPMPARADDALIKFLLGAAAVAVVVHGLKSGDAQTVHVPRHRPGSRVLPHQCRETLRIRNRDIEVYNARCLNRAGLHNLPQRCHETVRTNRGQRGVYRARCLTRAGFQPQAEPRRAPPRHAAPRPQPQPTVLPRQCAITYSYRGNHHRGFDAACLRRNGLRNLPQNCVVRGSNGNIYGAQCLRDAGYRRR